MSPLSMLKTFKTFIYTSQIQIVVPLTSQVFSSVNLSMRILLVITRIHP